MKKLLLCLLVSASFYAGEIHDHTITIRMNSDIETIDLSQQPPETRRILHKLAYKQYLQYNQWACFKAALLACSITSGISIIYMWWVNKQEIMFSPYLRLCNKCGTWVHNYMTLRGTQLRKDCLYKNYGFTYCLDCWKSLTELIAEYVLLQYEDKSNDYRLNECKNCMCKCVCGQWASSHRVTCYNGVKNPIYTHCNPCNCSKK